MQQGAEKYNKCYFLSGKATAELDKKAPSENKQVIHKRKEWL
jgi:hypothetical protein